MAMRSALIVALAVAATIAGCDSRVERATLAKVSGTVHHNGKPLAQGTIAFIPEKGRPASGKIQQGQIVELTTYEPNDGVPLGKHKVTIVSVDQPAAGMYTKTTSLIPPKYNDPSQSGLTAEIQQGSNALKFELND